MGDDWWNGSSAPRWLGEPLLQPGESVTAWRGPRHRRVLAWARDGIGLLKVHHLDGLLFLLYFAALPAFAFAGRGLFLLLGWADGGPGLHLGLLLALGLDFTLLGALIWSEQAVFQVLTNRRLVGIKNYELVHEIDLAQMRRLLATEGAARPAARVGEVEPLLHLVGTPGQLQAPSNGKGGP